jgi:uncharacterized protein (TIGR03437 family)
VSAFAQFNAALATSTATATPGTTEWPFAVGGASVTVTDSTGAALPAGIVYASPSQLNYRVPPTAAAGLAKVTITAAGTSVGGNITIAAAYPGLFRQTADGLAAGQIVRVHNGVQSFEPLSSGPVTLGSDQVYVVLYGTGIGSSNVSATIGGATATLAYAGPQGTYPGLDQVNLLIPSSLAGHGQSYVVITAGGRTSNPVYLSVR